MSRLNKVRVFKATLSKNKEFIILNVGTGIIKNKNDNETKHKLWGTILINRVDGDVGKVKAGEAIGLALKNGKQVNIDVEYKYMSYSVKDNNINILINGVSAIFITTNIEKENEEDELGF